MFFQQNNHLIVVTTYVQITDQTIEQCKNVHFFAIFSKGEGGILHSRRGFKESKF